MKIITTMLISFVLLSQQDNTTIKPTTAGQRTSHQEARVLGILGSGTDAKEVISAPASVRVGEDFQVTITSTGSGCEREGDTGVIMAENSATVMVYDFTSATRPGVACTMIFKQMPHTVTLRFTKPGEAVIRVWGRRIGGDTSPAGVPVVLEHRVMVK